MTVRIPWTTGTGDIILTYTGQGNGTIVVQSDNNNLSVARSQQLTVETTVGGTVSRTITVSQQAKPFTPTVINYSYTGSVQTVTLHAGTYKLECWGAQGGSGSGTGGKGGYSVGTLVLTEDTTLYIYVGGQGTDNSGSGSASGGFNGGGNSYGTTNNYTGGGGGGASDIRIGTDSLYARVIVAGGGGGYGKYNSSNSCDGGYGGGSYGGEGSSYDSAARAGTGGSFSKAGASYYGTNYNSTTYGSLAGFGVGGSWSGNTSHRTVGGGGGWYGGGYSQRAGAGGGSGYVYTSGNAWYYPSGCLLNSDYYLSDAETKDGDSSFPSTSGGTETGHYGNGYVRITQTA